ncbi:MAG: energy-coupling factor transporter transmembrane protein EcfT [Eubacterium sp.]|nr:energy-coupling factor transporter transmembrane protein EcfT [Eubacterium sp.]
MLRDITLGQYYSSDSLIHRLDARVKIIATILFIIELFLVKTFTGFAVCAGALALVVIISGVPLRFILRGLKPVLLILLFTFLLNIFMIPGTVIWELGFIQVTIEGLKLAAFMSIRLILLIIGSSMLTLTTTPLQLTDGLEMLFTPLSLIKVPTHELAMTMSIALRFIPTLLEETDTIMKAQQARGADFESGNFIRRAKALVPVLLPLFISAFRIAQDLSFAMEARCYRGGIGRTRMHKMKFSPADYAALLLMIAFFAAVIYWRGIL